MDRIRVEELDVIWVRRCPIGVVVCGAASSGLCHSACIDIGPGRQMHTLIKNELEYEKIILIEVPQVVTYN